MLLIMLGLIVAAVVMWRCGFVEFLLDEGFLAACIGAMLLFIGALAGVLVALIVGSFCDRAVEPTPEWSQQLMSLRSSDSISGHVFLLGGYVQSALTYTYYVKDGDAVMPRTRRADTGNVWIFEEKREDAVLEFHKSRISNPYMRPFALPDAGSFYFKVPVGTVSKTFNVD